MPEPSFDFPPDVFWIKPTGEVLSVIGHLTAMQSDPDAFGLPASPMEPADIDDAFTKVWTEGWARGRFSGATLSVQMGSPAKTPLEYVRAMVERHFSRVAVVEIDFANPVHWNLSRTMTAADFLSEKFPTTWGLGGLRR